jgi:hypothetical protein
MSTVSVAMSTVVRTGMINKAELLIPLQTDHLSQTNKQNQTEQLVPSNTQVLDGDLKILGKSEE